MVGQIAISSYQEVKCSDEQIGIHSTALGFTDEGGTNSYRVSNSYADQDPLLPKPTHLSNS
jgi:hypothetical protein